MDVVADEDERAFVLLERADEGVDAADVQVGRRLVHEQQIRRIEQQLDQREARFFSAAQHGDRLEDIVAAEEERAEHRARHLLGDGILHVLHALQHGLLRVQHLHAMLREVADLHVVPEFARARCTGSAPPSSLSSVDLPAPFGPDEHGALAALRLEVDPVVNHEVAVGVMHVLERDDALAARAAAAGSGSAPSSPG